METGSIASHSSPSCLINEEGSVGLTRTHIEVLAWEGNTGVGVREAADSLHFPHVEMKKKLKCMPGWLWRTERGKRSIGSVTATINSCTTGRWNSTI